MDFSALELQIRRLLNEYVSAIEVRKRKAGHLTPDAVEELLESTGRPIVDTRNGITTPRLDLFAAVMKLRADAKPLARRRAVGH